MSLVDKVRSVVEWTYARFDLLDKLHVLMEWAPSLALVNAI